MEHRFFPLFKQDDEWYNPLLDERYQGRDGISLEDAREICRKWDGYGKRYVEATSITEVVS